jgi:predicted helicase
MELHISFNEAKPYAFGRKDVKAKILKPILKALPELGTIKLDTETTLIGIPRSAWEYRLGNRSALEWVINQYQPKRPKDLTVRKLFNDYEYKTHKKAVIDLLAKVCTISIRTQELLATLEP